ncbi:MAG: SHOCT domain-containing protein [Thermoleophilia bacterium]
MGLMRMAARTAVISGTATAVSGRVARRQQGRWAEQDAQAAAAAPPPAPAPAAAAPAADADYMAELQQLARLRDAGVLTEEEFAAKKRQLLGI